MRTTKKKEPAPSSESVFVCVCGFVVLFFLSAMSALLSPPPTRLFLAQMMKRRRRRVLHLAALMIEERGWLIPTSAHTRLSSFVKRIFVSKGFSRETLFLLMMMRMMMMDGDAFCQACFLFLSSSLSWVLFLWRQLLCFISFKVLWFFCFFFFLYANAFLCLPSCCAHPLICFLVTLQ